MASTAGTLDLPCSTTDAGKYTLSAPTPNASATPLSFLPRKSLCHTFRRPTPPCMPPKILRMPWSIQRQPRRSQPFPQLASRQSKNYSIYFLKPQRRTLLRRVRGWSRLIVTYLPLRRNRGWQYPLHRNRGWQNPLYRNRGWLTIVTHSAMPTSSPTKP